MGDPIHFHSFIPAINPMISEPAILEIRVPNGMVNTG